MAIQKEKTEQRKSENILHQERRSFLKKSVYAAPTLIVMGELLKPSKAKAGNFGNNPSDAGGWN